MAATIKKASKDVIDEARRWAAMKQNGVSLRYMTEFGSRPTPRNLLISAQFLHKELPIRIARRAVELESLPYGLSQKPAILKVPFLLICFRASQILRRFLLFIYIYMLVNNTPRYLFLAGTVGKINDYCIILFIYGWSESKVNSFCSILS